MIQKPAAKPRGTARQPIASAALGDPAGPTRFADLVTQFGANHGNAVEAIRIGFPARLLKDTGDYFEVPPRRIRAIMRLPETTAQGLIRRDGLMDAAVSERMWRLANITGMALQVFDDEQHAKLWLRTPNLSFHDAAPMDYLDTEPGAMAVRQVLNALATGGVL